MRILTQTELQALLAAIPARSPFGARDRALFVLMLNTGLRVAEVAGLDVADVAEGRRLRTVLTLRGAIAKGGHGRVIELNSVARQAVADILAFNVMRGFSVAADAPLLMTRKHTRLPVRTIQHLMQTYRDKAKLSVAATPHTLRHQAATQLARCADLRVLSKPWATAASRPAPFMSPPAARIGPRPWSAWRRAGAPEFSGCRYPAAPRPAPGAGQNPG